MPVWRRLSVLVCLIACPFSSFAAAPSDQAAAEHVLGTQWRQRARRAGMIFAGTVLRTPRRLAQTMTLARAPSGAPSTMGGDFVEFQFRIDRAIAGVDSGQILTIREWAGASSLQPALRAGERVLLFLYPQSRLGLTSPVGGAQGQIRLDSTGQSIAEPSLFASNLLARSKSESQRDQNSPRDRDASRVHKRIVVALERAIRDARGESR